MEERIDEKIKEIETFLSELKEAIPESFGDYLREKLKKAACERYFEKIVEAVADLAHLVIKEEELKLAADDTEAFFILAEDKIIPELLAKRLKDAKGMRNVIAHEYGNIDNELIYEAITEELKKDIEEFLEGVKKRLK